MGKCAWPLGNDVTIDFDIYDLNTEWHDVSGLYIFCYLQNDGSWFPVYVGQADSFMDHFQSHNEKHQQAIECGATHIHTLIIPQQAKRDECEQMLLENIRPTLNPTMKFRRFLKNLLHTDEFAASNAKNMFADAFWGFSILGFLILAYIYKGSGDYESFLSGIVACFKVLVVTATSLFSA